MKKEEAITIQEYECETGCGVHILKDKKHICIDCGVDMESEDYICFECYKQFQYEVEYGSRHGSEYGPEEIEEEHARIRRNNDYNENNSYNEEEYNPYGLEVNTSFTLGLSLSNGGKRLLR